MTLTLGSFYVATQTTRCIRLTVPPVHVKETLSYRRETALQGALVLAKSGRLELGHNILRTL